MKTISNLWIILLSGIFAVSCSSLDMGEEAETTEAKQVNEIEGDKQVYVLEKDNSTIEWMGSKPTGKHHGTIDISNGELIVKDGKLVGGEFVIDMKSIVNHDLEDEEYNTKLVNHLHSDDFFSTDVHPQATFVITSVEAFEGNVETGQVVPTHTVTGNLTIKDITKSVKFNTVVEMSENSISAKTVPFVIDRTHWDVKYKSNKFFDNLKDDFIHDDIGLKINITSSQES